MKGRQPRVRFNIRQPSRTHSGLYSGHASGVETPQITMALTVAARQHGVQNPQWHSSPPTLMFPFSFPTHTPPPHSMLSTPTQMQMPTPSPTPSASSMTSNSTLSSIPPHNTRELTREMLIVVLEHFSTLLPSRFDDHPVRLVVHGGACMLLHPDLDKLAAQTPPFLLSPAGFCSYYDSMLQAPQHHSQFPFSTFANSQTPRVAGSSASPLVNNDNSNATTRPSTPPPDVKRTTTRDVDIVARSFDSEWRQIGITNATELLKECIALTAKKFGLGMDWMNNDADVALPMAFDPISNTTYDPIHTDALKPNNIARHTVYTSSNGLLQLISVTPVWAVALKLVRFTKSDPGDICLILRNGTNTSGTKWTEELVESWLLTYCWPMGYRDYDPIKRSQLKAKIKFVVAMVNEYEDVPKSMRKERERMLTPTPTRSPPHHSFSQPVYPYQVPLAYPAAMPNFAYNIPLHLAPYHSPPMVAPSPPSPPPPPPPPKDSLQSRTSTFLPRSIAEWGSAPIPAPPCMPVPATAVHGQEGRPQANRRTTEPVIPSMEVDTQDRGRSRERRTQTWPLVGSLLTRGEDKNEKGERDAKEQREEREGRDRGNRTRQKVVDWLKANNRHQKKEKRNGSDVEREEGHELPVVPLLARPPSPPQFRASPPRDLQDTRAPLVMPTITVVDSSLTMAHSAPSEESDTLTITEKEGVTPWHPYHQPTRQRTPEHPPHARQQQQPDTSSWMLTTQPPSSFHPPPLLPPIATSHHPNEGGGEAFVPPFLPNNINDDEIDSNSSSDDLENNTLLLSFPSSVGASSPPPLAAPGGPPGFVLYPPGTPTTMPVIPSTMPTTPGIVAPVYSPASYAAYPGNPGYATSGFAGFYGGLAPYQQPHTHTPYTNQSQNQELHGQGQGQERDNESPNRRGISSWM